MNRQRLRMTLKKSVKHSQNLSSTSFGNNIRPNKQCNNQQRLKNNNNNNNNNNKSGNKNFNRSNKGPRNFGRRGNYQQRRQNCRQN